MSSNGDNSSSPSKRCVGRRKLPMTKIQRESNLQVTFSKRRSGVFKKANELCTLTGSEAALVVFSPANKAFSYGHPNVDEVMNRFANYPGWNVRPEPENPEMRELERVETLLDAQKARKKELRNTCWDQLAQENESVTPSAIQKMSYNELNKLKESMLALKLSVQARLIEKQTEEAVADGVGNNGAGEAIPYQNEDVYHKDDDGEITDSEDSVVELLEDGVGRRFF